MPGRKPIKPRVNIKQLKAIGKTVDATRIIAKICSGGSSGWKIQAARKNETPTKKLTTIVATQKQTTAHRMEQPRTWTTVTVFFALPLASRGGVAFSGEEYGFKSTGNSCSGYESSE